MNYDLLHLIYVMGIYISQRTLFFSVECHDDTLQKSRLINQDKRYFGGVQTKGCTSLLSCIVFFINKIFQRSSLIKTNQKKGWAWQGDHLELVKKYYQSSVTREKSEMSDLPRRCFWKLIGLIHVLVLIIEDLITTWVRTKSQIFT